MNIHDMPLETKIDATVPPAKNEESQPLPLFRPEVHLSRSSQWAGAISLAQPVSRWLVAGIAFIVGLLLILFISFGSFTKKNRVVGIIVPQGGSLGIAALAAGVLTKNFVKEGQHVQIGDPLFELSTARQAGDGEITGLIAQQLAVRRQTLDAERRVLITRIKEKGQQIDERQRILASEISQLNVELELAGRREELAKSSVAKYETLQRSGYVSDAQVQQKQVELIDYSSRLSSLQRTKAQQAARNYALDAERTNLAGELTGQLVQLDRAVASISQEAAENENRKLNFITAPSSGTITTITYQAGQTVSGGQALATLVPDATEPQTDADGLEVHLYAPSRTTGFVAVGQDVLMRLQAYPYQKFGLQTGVITGVSNTPFAPTELPVNLASTILSNSERSLPGSNSNEALYRIKVRLARSYILVNGKRQSLRPGMALEADIIQDKRQIWEWIAEPLLTRLNG
ncbi:HlyD family secretion protein [Janthinobacterium kumbetense]|uniref:HlyD family efflux transporter periplasmic adaptor subunit n=1 Tax=Janthinobacterium kumbetense TaxID=2950280 RepID=A0ABT0WQA7_9BURK|nr:HlyD family efflux transporter periplasmic adaptor subunit [Janthinobacterium kumbetense]MCM2566138.1 HlyD family efflux transporter periplasmic adaptor subunit [Janthinobacterium kumbetense]